MKNNLQKFNYLLSWISFLLFQSTSSYAQIQTFEWAKIIDNSGEAYTIATDSKGNVFSGGIFDGTTDFDPGPGIYELDKGGMYITKMNSTGQLVWAKAFSGGGGAVLQNIAIDQEGSVYATGYFLSFDIPGLPEYAIDFNPGQDTFNLFAEFIDVFVTKLDSNGNFVWAVQLNGDDGISLFNQGYQLNVEEPGSVYVTGAFGGTVDFDPGSGTNYITAPGYEANIFVCRLNAWDGSLNWAASVAGEDKGVGTGIVRDELNNIYVTGTFSGIQDFNPDPLDTFNVAALGAKNSFVLKLDSGGNFKWMKLLGGVSASSSNSCEGWGIAIHKDRLYITGMFQGTIDFDPSNVTFVLSSNSGKWDSYIWSLDTSGAFQWAKMVEGNDDNGGTAISTDNHGNVYVIGTFKGTADFNPNSTFSLSANNGTDIFISKFRDNGDFIWAGQLGDFNRSTGSGHSHYSAIDIDIDGAGNLYATSEFKQNVDLDPGFGTYMMAPSGLSSIFILKLGCSDTTSSTINAATCSQYELNGVSYTQSGTYTQVVPNPAGCDSTITLNLTIDPVNTGVTPGEGELKANWNDATYQWIDCGDNSLVAGATAQTFVPVAPGDYAVIVSKHGCSDTSDCIFVATGIPELNSPDGYTLYPNPAAHTVTLITEGSLENGACSLTNNLGQVVWQQKGLHGGQFTFDISSLVPGMYFFELQSGDKKLNTKMVKQ